MKRWKIDHPAARCLVAAVFAVSLVVGWADEPRAQPQALPSRTLASTFSREALDRIGDYLRNEIASGKIPGAVLLIQQHGKPVYFENFGVRDVVTKLPMSADTISVSYTHLTLPTNREV